MIHLVWWRFNQHQLRNTLETDSTIQGIHSTIMYSDFFPEPQFKYVYGFGDLPYDSGALVIVNGGNCRPDEMEILNALIRPLPWVVIMVVFDEGSLLPLAQIRHPNMKIWVQEPKIGVHDNMRRIPLGYTLWAKQNLPLALSRPWDWFFGGRMGHVPEWDKAIRNLTNGRLYDVPRDAENYIIDCLNPASYMQAMGVAKVIPCRPGNCTPETSRVYEALEAGCVPIVCKFPPEGGWKVNYPWPNYWEYVLGENPPFPIINGPEELAGAIQQALAEWPINARRIGEWWHQYKRNLHAILFTEIQELICKS